MGILGLLLPVINTITLNMNIKFYNNIDVMPIYQSSILVNMMIAGMVLMDESKFYSWTDLFVLFFGVFVIISGIYVLTKKHNKVVQSESRNKIASDNGEDFHLELVRDVFKEQGC